MHNNVSERVVDWMHEGLFTTRHVLYPPPGTGAQARAVIIGRWWKDRLWAVDMLSNLFDVNQTASKCNFLYSVFVYIYVMNTTTAKGRLRGTFWMNFWKTSEGGGHFPSKKFCCGFFGNFGGVKTMNFRKKEGGSRQSEWISLQIFGPPEKSAT